MAQLEFENVAYHNDGRDILSEISAEFQKGDFVSIVGPSGCGKSTFLKLCCHLISPTEGEIRIDGQNIMLQNPIELRKQVSYCFQTPVLFPETVEDNLNYPFLIRKQKTDWSRIDALFERFQMNEDYIKQEVRKLSGGEKQRIALIRTLLFAPRILLLDEVTSALDTGNAEIVESAIKSLSQEGVTIFWVTHNPEQSRKYANRLLTLEDGKIKALEALR